MSPKMQKAIIGVFLAICVLSGGIFLLRDCGPTEEDLKTLNAVNGYTEIVERGGHVEHIKFLRTKDDQLAFVENYQGLSERRKERMLQRLEHRDEAREDKDMPFWAEILDDGGNVIGQVAGFRVEGFGVARPDCHWVGEEVPEDEGRGPGFPGGPPPGHPGRRGGPRGDRRGPPPDSGASPPPPPPPPPPQDPEQ